MTRSGQGDEARLPAARPAHEGVVLPADGSEPWIPGVSGEQVAPAGGTPWGDPWGPAQGAHGGQGQQQVPGQPAPYAQPLPPQQAAQPLPPYDNGSGAGAPPVQYGQPGQQPPYAQPADADATQYIAPVPPTAGALPPETPAESTQFLGLRPSAGGGDADATQFLPPVPAGQVPAQPNGAPYGLRPGAPGDRQPPAEFDNLFRSEGPTNPPGATQHLPRFAAAPAPASAPQQQYGQQQYGQQQYAPAPEPAHYAPASDGPQRRPSRVPLIAAVVVGCAVLGLGVSALMFGGGDESKGDDKTVAAATSPAPGATTQGAADPAKAQAEALDKLLADSNDSRAAVIRSVESIKSCKNLDQAAGDLRGAAEQRRGLVTRLEGLTVDKLADNEELTGALTKAWEASARADDHYAEWAGQVDGKKGCRGGKARQTGQSAAGNRASGDATTAKREAAGLWNTIAGTYGLTKREATQL
ncbi:hypothetical protein ACFU5O_18535 [Streptomyces sp. NPDC057445]|uniref:hypothetical protein n=1 Tax=Streptomyces sp. NPDC057445 TaxID=3346136 RepID=UPI0036BE633A